MARTPDTKEGRRARAEAQFQQAVKADDDRARFKAEEALKARAVDEKTARLKALRLARDAAETGEQPAQKPPSSCR